ncbi:MAG TPA: VOC family protein [Rhabdaerophilum sp.]|nr:VOC family protein [Rhabdaerophilum sp.]
MVRPLDHLVIGVPDLAEAGARFESLGFQVGGVNRHPWGTHNRIVQFADETFLELITVGEPEKIPQHTPRHFSFGAFVRDALARRPGLSMLVLKGMDARADAAGFRKAGIGDFEPFDFSRKGHRPDGSETEVAFSLAFAADPALPEAAFFTCQQHFPQNFWSKAAQSHANGAKGIARVTLVAENPSDHHIFLGAFIGNREMRATSFGIEIEAERTTIEIVSRIGFAFRYGFEAPLAATPVFAGVEIAVPSLVAVPGQGAMKAHSGGLSLPPDATTSTVFRLIKG